jgi:phospho-N-acetylmuramoyl-pentapeptide-transferase
MALYLGVLIFSFIVTSVAIVPFIDFLYRVKLIHKDVHIKSGGQTIHKIGKPTGVGVLIIFLVTALFIGIFPLMQRLGVFVTSSFSIKPQLNIIFFTFIGFGLLGLYEDVMKIYNLSQSKIVPFLKIALSVVAASLLYFHLGISIVNIPFLGVFNLSWVYIPFASLIIAGFTYAFDLTDGLDGLSCGLLMICLLAFWVLSVAFLDTPLSIFIALWIGSLIAFLYFNVYPSRVWLGNAGGLAFGATLAVVGLLLGKVVALLVIGGIFVAELLSHLLKLVPITPLHHWLQTLGWPEPKITMRAWITAVMLAIFGVWLAYL